jgi:hypothetical protein
MNIATVVNVHGNTELVLDTLDAIKTWVTDKILVVVDGANWDSWGRDVQFPAHKLCGFSQRSARAPYRNVALGLQQACSMWPDLDWLCYTEYDCLFTSDRFKKNLEMADERNVWILGNDGRVDHYTIPWLESWVGPMKTSYYLLGCCQFFSRKLLDKFAEIKLFDKFLHFSSSFSGQVPSYPGYDISEHMYPSLARHFGGNVGVFASWDGGHWHGSSDVFPMRWKPEVTLQECNLKEVSIIHPLKTFNHPLRVLFRRRRRECEQSESLSTCPSDTSMV